MNNIENIKSTILFPDYAPNMSVNAFLFLNKKNWCTVIGDIIEKISVRYGIEKIKIEKAIYKRLDHNLVVLYKHQEIKISEISDISILLEVIADCELARKQYMYILQTLNIFFRDNYEEKVTLDEIMLCAPKNKEEDEIRCWYLISQHYNIIPKRNRSNNKIADLRQSEPEIRNRIEVIANNVEVITPYIIDNKDKKKLWNIICSYMPEFTEFSNQLGTSFYWKGCFGCATRASIIAANDKFYQEILEAFEKIKKEYSI